MDYLYQPKYSWNSNSYSVSTKKWTGRNSDIRIENTCNPLWLSSSWEKSVLQSDWLLHMHTVSDHGRRGKEPWKEPGYTWALGVIYLPIRSAHCRAKWISRKCKTIVVIAQICYAGPTSLLVDYLMLVLCSHSHLKPPLLLLPSYIAKFNQNSLSVKPATGIIYSVFTFSSFRYSVLE